MKAIIKGEIKNSASRVGGTERPGRVPCTLAFAPHSPKSDLRGQWVKCWKSSDSGVVAGIKHRLDKKQNAEGALKAPESWLVGLCG